MPENNRQLTDDLDTEPPIEVSILNAMRYLQREAHNAGDFSLADILADAVEEIAAIAAKKMN